MKLFLGILALFAGSLAMAANKIVDYNYGNQITRSTLVVFDDGRILHTERVCCPPQVEEITEANLSSETLSKLLLWIDLASVASQSSFEAGQSGQGTSAGKLTAIDKNGTAFNVRTIEFGDLQGGLQPVHFNTAPESREIEQFVFSLVDRKMIL